MLVRRIIKGRVVGVTGNYAMTQEDIARHNTESSFELCDSTITTVREVIAVYVGKDSTVLVCEETETISKKVEED